MSKSKILFQMTGSIACYKACMVLSKLVQAGYDVQVVASPSALQFIGNATIEGLTGKPVVSDLFESGNVMDHIHLVRWADLILIAPASANFINKAAHGVGDDLITTQFLAHDFKKPLLLAPAMNTMMYLHPVTQASIKKLREMGVEILETASGVLACGEVGWGRLLEPDLIFQEVQKHLAARDTKSESVGPKKSIQAAKVLITSGGTQEPIDPVRFITNLSTGSTGAAIADSLVNFGFDVTYLHAQSALQPKSEVQRASFQTFNDLQTRLQELLSTGEYRAVIHVAAVSDFSPAHSKSEKISSDENLVVEFKKNPKLVDQMREMAKNPNLKVIAFKMTATSTKDAQKTAVQKLFAHSKANLVVQNDMSEINPSSGQHLFHLYSQDGSVQDIQNKQALGFQLGEYLLKEIL